MRDADVGDLPDDIARFDRLWNGSEPGWVVQVHHDDAATIWVPIPATGITPSFFKAVRSLLSEFSAMSTSEFHARLNADGGIETEILDDLDAEYLYREGLGAGLELERRARPHTFYRIFNERTNYVLQIEDDELHCLVAEEAIRRGVRIRESTT